MIQPRNGKAEKLYDMISQRYDQMSLITRKSLTNKRFLGLVGAVSRDARGDK